MSFNPFRVEGGDVTAFTGFVKSIAAATNPLQSEITFVLTDFKPNNNSEAIDITEADNIISSVVSMPLKANFTQGAINGHALALPVGTITHAELVTEPEPYILARATFWRDEYKELDQYLRTKIADGEPIGTSWELLYNKNKAELRDGVKWLKDVIVAASTIVRKPAYGSRTPVLAIAEDMQMNADTSTSLVAQLYDLECQCRAILDMICDLYEDANEADEQTEQTQVLSAIDSLPSKLKELATKIGSYKVTEAELQTALETAQAESANLQSQLDEIKRAEAESNLFTARTAILSEQNIAVSDDKKAFILSLSEDQFTAYVDTISAVIKSTAETKVSTNIKVPNILGATKPSVDDVVSAFKTRGK